MMPPGAEILFSRETIDSAVRRVAAEVEQRFGAANPVLLCVLLGGLPFTATLRACLACQHSVDTVQVSRYRDGADGGQLKWLQRPATPLSGRVVVIVDDVLDEGHTLAAIREDCLAAGAHAVTAAVLVRKSTPGKPAATDAEFIGLEAGADFLFGFGMDYRGRHRELPDIYRMETEASDD